MQMRTLLSQPNSNAMTPNINADAKLTTLINVFSVAAEDRDRLVALLKEGTAAWICKVPGFVSSSLHVSRDGRRVVIYGQRRSADGTAAMRQRPEIMAKTSCRRHCCVRWNPACRTGRSRTRRAGCSGPLTTWRSTS
jgi:hypothetical protein